MPSKEYKEISFILPQNEANDSNETMLLKIYECIKILDSGFGCYLWPASIYLADYLWRERAELAGKSVVELGAGCGLAGLVCAKLGASSILTDHPNNARVLSNCIKNVNENQLENCCQVKPLAWGRFTKDIQELPSIDFIIGSDTFYDRKDFEPLLATVAFLIEQNPDAIFLTAYQERSTKRTIQPLLDYWGLTGHLIDPEIPTAIKLDGKFFDPDYPIYLFQIYRQ